MKNKGITLIALVITIVVLIILAAVAINLSLGNNGIFNRAKTAKEQYQNATQQEETEITQYSNKIENYIDGNRTFEIKNLELDYDNKVDIKGYNSSSNVFTVPNAGVILAAATGKNDQAGGSRIYINNIGLWICGDGSSSAWGRQSTSLFVTKGNLVYFYMYGNSVLDVGYYVPFK